MKYDYLIVGAGLFGAIFAHEAKKAGKKVLVIDRRDHIGGNIYTKEVEGIQVHQLSLIHIYMAWIFSRSSVCPSTHMILATMASVVMSPACRMPG